MDDKVAVVTGANKGIGYATVRKLCKRGLRYVYYTEKIASQGQMAIDNLKKEGVEPLFHQLTLQIRTALKHSQNT
ncbi:jg10149 [Pararge aegeria aegeria]|uniref:Jg10149 protein n=1 Tax=Pararge aegeria aegeria TaxID=348720 RepID=A0A8S4RAS6_9NEOP|nr:jg10149 [Pararge aegeria aegeria]